MRKIMKLSSSMCWVLLILAVTGCQSVPTAVPPSLTAPATGMPSPFLTATATGTTSPIPTVMATETTSQIPTAALVPVEQLMFDDFSYTSQGQMVQNGWIVRNSPGWPGIPGASFSKDNVTLVDDPAQPGNRLVQMTSSTDGSSARTVETQFCHQRKYFEGTYAARVKFSDAPVSGPDGDQIVETFYMISPSHPNRDPNHSEMDFEYTPNGGWGMPDATFYATTWYTYQLEPWYADNASQNKEGSRDGWHTLVVQVAGGQVKYFVDGTPFASHGGKYYPRIPMSINFNLWFTNVDAPASSEPRQYNELVDWAFHAANSVLSPDEVESRVGELRQGLVHFIDSVPAMNPPLESPCNF